MAVPDMDKEDATVQIGICEVELFEAETDGVETPDAEATLKLARSFLKSGDYNKAFLFAVRARRMAVEGRRKLNEPPPNVK
jgi:hypothetical protein